MRVETTVRTLYTFDELSEEAQEKAIDNLRDINVQDTFWSDYDCKMGLSSDELKARRMKEEHIFSKDNACYFDVGRGSYIQLHELEVNNDEDFRKWLRIPKQLWSNCYYTIDREPFRETNTKLLIESDKGFGVDFTEREQEIIDRAIEIFDDKVGEALSDLRKNFEYQHSDEAVKATIEANEYEFTEDGKLT
jgi:hypothetical protein